MDSPEVKPSSSASPATVQDSPFFNYLETLSPIKPVKAQRFSEYNFPPPPPVFTSPRINSAQEASFLKRIEFPRISDVEFHAEVDNKVKIIVRDVDIRGSFIPLSDLISSTQKERDNEGSEQAKTSSPTATIDEFLTDPMDDICNSANLHDMNLKKATDILHALWNDRSSTDKSCAKLDDWDGDDKEERRADVSENSITLVQKEEDQRIKFSVCLKSGYAQNVGGREKIDETRPNEDTGLVDEKTDNLVETDTSRQTDPTKGYGPHLEELTNTCSASTMYKDTHHGIVDWEKQMLSDHSGCCHHPPGDVSPRNIRSALGAEQDCAAHFLPDCSQNAETDGNCCKNTRNNDGFIENRMTCEHEEGNQHQCSMRKRLHFESAEVCKSSSESENTAVIVSNACSNPINVGTLNSSQSDAISRLRPSIKSPFHKLSTVASCTYRTPKVSTGKVDRCAQNSESSFLSSPRPSGIGLHLNSIGNAPVMNHGGIVQSDENECMRSKGAKVTKSVVNHPLLEGSMTCSVSVNLMGKLPVKQTLVSDFSLACMENTKEDHEDTQPMVLLNSSALSTSVNANPPNIKPLRVVDCCVTLCDKNPSSQDPCRFEEANQLSPKKKRTKIVAEDDGCKRCSCKRSKCLKLYCECFAAKRYCSESCTCKECLNKPEYEEKVFDARRQIESRNPTAFAPRVVVLATESPHKRAANVGCSDGCRCDGCKNTFGPRTGNMHITKVDDRNVEDEEYEKDITDENVDTVDTRINVTYQKKLFSCLSPMTPMFPCSNKRSDLPKSQISTRRYLSSPESSVLAESSSKKSQRSPRSPIGTKKIVKLGGESACLLPYEPELDLCKEQLDESSPGWDGLRDICEVSPLPHPSPETATSTASGIVKMSQGRLSEGASLLSGTGLRWRCSPVTPMPQFGGGKFVLEPDSESGQYNMPERDTPEILKDAESPIKMLKTSSPKQKRVSPPKLFHGMNSLSSSIGLKIGRKFILKSVPSFPPLSPDSDSKGSKSDMQDL
ncbi:Protein tesmin/TSO1-like CXC 2 [Acorus gramineus]|uniref:Protein tesmin/TSO1-like CXC 2 n=1 Tax=Acorus gramineus TaxID=55184 RepID=A0AAV9A4I4_ACOGR|nr:Protein tesmin/TSO1-like CXC 2 [Acorus gramineus]